MAFSKRAFGPKVLVLCLISVFSASAWATDLLTVYRSALAYDAVYAQAQAKREASQEKSNQGRAALLPTINLNGSINSNHDEVENHKFNTKTDHSYGSHSYSLTLTQPLFRWQNWVGFEQSKLQVAQAEVAFLSAKQDLILRTAQAYFEQLQAQEKLNAANAYKTAVESQLDIARKAFAVGTGVKTDIFDAETRFQLALSQTIVAQSELELRQRALQSITGQYFEQVATRRQQLDLSFLGSMDLSQLLQEAEQSNLQIQEQRLALEIASREIERQRAGHYPTLDLVASKGNSSTLNSGSREISDTSRIGIQVNVPIFQGGEVVSRTNEAAANYRLAKSGLDAARNSMEFNVRQAYLGVSNGLAQIKIMKSALDAAQNAQTSNKDAFDVGVRLNIDVLNAQNQVFNTQSELIRVTAETFLAFLKLKAASGTLGESDVLAISALLVS